MTFRRGESGNVFFTLFGAVALVGVIGVATSSLMRGPVGTVVSLNQRAKVESQLQIARKLVALNAAQTTADCDGDGTIEATAPDTATAGCAGLLTGGGCLPAGVGAAKTDPWGTLIGYCGWNQDTLGGGFNQAADCAGNTLLVGENGTSDKTVLAVISAGPDRTFQTSCVDHPGYVNKPATSDDIVFEWTYDEASEGLGGGLWSLVSGGGDRITTDKDIEIGRNATFASGSQSTYQAGSSASFGAGSMLDFTGGGLFRLPTEATSGACNTANESMLRVKTDTGGQILQICDPDAGPAEWIDIGGSGSSNSVAGGTGDIQFNSGGELAANDGLNWDGSSLRVGDPVTTNDTLEIAGTLGVSGVLTAEDEIQVGLGSAADPSYSFIGSDTSGFYNDSGNVGISVAGIERLLADTNGVDINGALYVDGDANLGDTLYVSGGTTLVDGPLDVRGNIFNGTTGTVDVTINDSLTVTGAADFNSPVTMDNTLDVTGTATAGFFAVDGVGGNDGMDTDGSGGMVLQTNGTPRIQIDSAGDVGIGLVGSPTARLDVGGAIRLRDIGAEEGVDCTGLNGSISYDPDEDEFLVCSNVTTTWETVGTSGGGGGGVGGLWHRLNGALQPITGQGVDDFIVGGTQLDDSGTNDARMFFDKSLGAFRAGTVDDDQWNETNRGAGSVALGRDTMAAGDGSFAAGDDSIAGEDGAVALGTTVEANAPNSVALGHDAVVFASGNNSMALGLGNASGTVPQVSGSNSFGIFMGDQSNVDLNWSNVMLLAGGSLVIDPDATSAVNITPTNGLTVDVEGNVGAINFCDQDGLFCFTPEDIATGSTGAPGDDREIIFNSTGSLDADDYFVYTSAGRLGLGTESPDAKLRIVERAGDTGDLFSVSDTAGRTVSVDDEGQMRIISDADDNFSFAIRVDGDANERFVIGSNGRVYWGDGTNSWDASIGYYSSNFLTTDSNDIFGARGGLAVNTLELTDGTGGGGQQLVLDVEGAAGATFYCNEVGEDCFTAADIAGNSFNGDERGVVFNSGNALTTDPNFIFTSAGYLGVGNNSPLAALHVGPTAPPAGGISPDIILASNGKPQMMWLDLGDDTSLIGLSDDDYFTIASEDSQSGIQFRVDGDFGTDYLNTAYTAMRIMNDGQVGLNVVDPETRLDVAGTLKIGYESESCDTQRVGGIQFSSGAFWVCESAGSWEQIATGTLAAAAPDRGIQFNSNGNFAADNNFSYTSEGNLVIGTAAAPGWFSSLSGALYITDGIYSEAGIIVAQSTGYFGFSDSASQISGDTEFIEFTVDSTDIARFTSAGSFGLGTLAPDTRLDVDGTIKMGYGNELCDTDRVGSIQYSSGAFYVCRTPGSWDILATGTPSAAAPDRGIQFNSGGNFEASANLIYTSAGTFMVAGTHNGTPNVPVEGAGSRMFFDPQMSAFRAGNVTGDQWNNDEIGEYSAVIGKDSVASGIYSIALGEAAQATGGWSLSMGSESQATENFAVAIGNLAHAQAIEAIALGTQVTVTGENAMAIGLGEAGPNATVSGAEALGIFMGDQDGLVLSTANTFGVFGGKMVIDPAVPATNLVADTALEIDGTLKIGYGSEICDAARVGGIQYSSNAFYVCRTPGSWDILATGTPSAAAPDRGVQFNSGGNFTATSDLLYTATGDLIFSNGDLSVGAGATPQTRLDVDGTIRIAYGGEDCDLAREGAIYYDSGDDKFYACQTAGGWTELGAGAESEFTALTDTPTYYSNSALQWVRVNSAEDGLEFTDEIIESVSGEPAPAGWALAELSDVDVAGVIDGQVLLYSAGAGAWVGATAPSGSSAFTDLTDTPSVYASAGQFVRINATEDGLEFTDELIESYTGGTAPTALMLSGLGDVDVAGVGEGDVLLYSGGEWISGSGGGGAFTALSDTPSLYASAGMYVRINATEDGLEFTNEIVEQISGAAPVGMGLDNLSDVEVSGVADGQVLLYSGGAGQWIAGSAGAGSVAFTDLTDAPSSYGSAGMYVRINGAGNGLEFTESMIRQDTGGAPTGMTLDDLTNVDVTSVADGQVLMYSAGAGEWVAGTGGGGGGDSLWEQGSDDDIYYNSGTARVGIGNDDPATALDVTGVVTISNGIQLGLTGGASAPSYLALEDLANVDVGGVTAGQVLLYSGGEWIAGSGGGGGAFTDLSDTPASYASAGQFVRINASEDGLEFTDQIIETVSGQPAPDALTLSVLGDVDVSGVADGQVLMYSAGAGAWVAGAGGGGGGAIDDLSDAVTNYAVGNMFMGQGAGAGTTTAEFVTAVGLNALAANDVSEYSTAFGANAGVVFNPGSEFESLTALGKDAASAVTGGYNLTAVGTEALQNIQGNHNTAIGARSLTKPGGGSGDNNTAVGAQSGWYMSGDRNVIVGADAAQGGFSSDYDHQGNDNIFVGASAASNMTGNSNNNNIIIGSQTAASLRNGASNIIIGHNVDVSSGTSANQMNIGNVIYASGLYGTAHIGINQSSPDVALDVSGDIEYTGTITDVSDIRLKTDIEPLRQRGSMLDRLGAVETYSFRMKDDEAGRTEFGVMAQELEQLFPELVHTADDDIGTKSVNYVGLIAPMIEASKELKAENVALRGELAQLRAERDEMQVALNDLVTDVKGLKAHTGYGIGRAEMSLWIIFAAIGSGTLVLLFGGMVRNRQQRAE